MREPANIRSRTGALLATCLLCACWHDVTLTVRNPTSNAYDAKVVGAKQSPLELGSVPAKGEVQRTFKVKENATISVEAAYPDSARVWHEPRTVTGADPDPLPYTAVIKPTAAELPEFDPSLISDKLKSLGPCYGFDAVPVRDALQALFGGICVVTKIEGRPIEIHRCFTPGEISNELAYEAFHWPDASEQFSLEVTSESSVKLAASFAIYSGAAAITKGGVRKYDTLLSGFGTVARAGSPTLAAKQVAEIARELKAHDGSKLLYLNRMWVAKQGYVRSYDGEKVQSGIDAAAGAILTANGAFTWSSTVATSRTFSEVALEFWGEERALPDRTFALTGEKTTLAPVILPARMNLTSEALNSVMAAARK